MSVIVRGGRLQDSPLKVGDSVPLWPPLRGPDAGDLFLVDDVHVSQLVHQGFRATDEQDHSKQIRRD